MSCQPQRLVAFLVLFLGLTSSSQAGLVLSISSQSDLSNIAVGTGVLFEVRLMGATTDQPGFLTASLQYDSTVFGDPTIQAGSIVPGLLGFDPTGTGFGTVTASYDDSIFGTSPITSDGPFYLFTLIRLGAQETTLSFSGFAAMNDLGQVISVSTDPDSVAVGAAPGQPGQSVPEPSIAVLALSGLVTIGLRLGRRQAIR